MITGNGIYNSSIEKPDLEKKKKMEDFPGDPGVKTLCSRCSREAGLILVGIPHVV